MKRQPLLIFAVGLLLSFCESFPGNFSFPSFARLWFLAVQTIVFLIVYYLLKRENKLALLLVLSNLYLLLLSTKVIYFSRPFLIKSELLLSGKPTLYWFWFFFLYSLLISGLLWALKRAGKIPAIIAASLLILATFLFNLRFYSGKTKILLTSRAAFINGLRVINWKKPVHFLRSSHAGELLEFRKKRMVLRLKRGELYGLRNFTVARGENFYLRKKGIFLETMDEKIPLLVPWHFLEIFLLPLALLLLFLSPLVRKKYFPYFVILILSLLFLAQGIYLYKISPRGYLYFDNFEYLMRAESILRGFSLGEEILIGGNGPCYWPPLTTLFNAGFVWAFSRNWTVYIFLKTLMFMAVLFLLFKLAGKFNLNPIVLLLLFGLSGYTIYYVSIESEGLFLFFLVLSLFLVLEVKGTSSLLSGLFLGLATLTRAMGLPLALFWGILKRKRGLLFLAVFSLTILPWEIRCYLREKEVVVINKGGKYSFLWGNSPFSTGGWASLLMIKRKFREMGYNPESKKDVILYNLRHPGNILRLLPGKIYWTFWKEPKNRQWHPPGAPYSRCYGISFLRFKFYTPFSEGVKIFLYLFALLGLLQGLREWGRFKYPLIALLCFVFTILAFMGLPRYMAGFLPFITIFSVRGMKT